MNVWRILARYAGWRLAIAVGAGLGGGAALAALVSLIHRALTLPRVEVPALAWSFMGLLLAYFVGTVAAQQSLNDAAERLQWEMRTNLLRQTIALPLRRIEALGESRLFSILGTDVRQIADYLCTLPDAAVNAAVALGCFSYMAWLSPTVTLFNLAFVALAAACYLAPQRISRRIGESAAEAADRHALELQYALRGAKPLQLGYNRRRSFLAEHFNATGAKVRELVRRSRFLHLLSERFAEAMVLGNVAVLLFVLPRFIDLPVSTATGLLLAAMFVRQPLKDSIDIIPRTQRIGIALSRMQAAGLRPFETTPPETEPAGTTGRFRRLNLKEASFTFEPDHDQAGFAAGPFSLEINAGEVVFIVGGNGAGKTTLAKLLCGLYAPTRGTVSLDDESIHDEAGRIRLRNHFSAVFAEDPTFDHLLGVSDQTAQAAGTALLTALHLNHKVTLEGKQFSTLDLSQGQRRRLNLLGAILEDRPLLLLDEWTADQDPHFRLYFYDHLLPMLRTRGKTVVMITHDDRYFDRADRVLKLENGHLVTAPRVST